MHNIESYKVIKEDFKKTLRNKIIERKDNNKIYLDNSEVKAEIIGIIHEKYVGKFDYKENVLEKALDKFDADCFEVAYFNCNNYYLCCANFYKIIK